jgi:hypothetical protein
MSTLLQVTVRIPYAAWRSLTDRDARPLLGSS